MSTPPSIEIDRDALSLAGLAFMETDGSSNAKIRAAITGYLWAVASAQTDGDWVMYPSLNDLRAFLAGVEA